MSDRSTHLEVDNLDEITDVVSVQSSFDHGSNLDIDTAAEQITTTSFTTKHGVLIVADSANAGTLFIGNSDVTAGSVAATDGIPLYAGGHLFIPLDNPNKLYAIGSAANQKIYWFAV